jgi:hypothetical protein
MTRRMGMEFIVIIMGANTKEIGKMISKTD